MSERVTIDLNIYNNLIEVKESVVNKDNVIYHDRGYGCGAPSIVSIYNADEYLKDCIRLKEHNSVRLDKLLKDLSKQELKHNKELIRLIKLKNNLPIKELLGQLLNKIKPFK